MKEEKTKASGAGPGQWESFNAPFPMTQIFGQWAEELQRDLATMVEQYSSARAELLKCRSVFDIVKVEQEFIAARSKAYFDAGLRIARLFGTAAEQTAESMSQTISPHQTPPRPQRSDSYVQRAN